MTSVPKIFNPELRSSGHIFYTFILDTFYVYTIFKEM